MLLHKSVWRVGLIVNPRAGLGGELARHGSDTLDPSMMDALPARSSCRAAEAIAVLDPEREIQWLTGAGRMGETMLREAGCQVEVVAESGSPCSAADTRQLARKLADAGVDLVLFSGGDGTARDVLDAVGETIVTLGIPAGVKMQSAVFGTSPRAAGRLARSFLTGSRRVSAAREVMDLDEQGLAAGQVAARLYGYLATPLDPALLQGKKSRSSPDDRSAADALARYLAPSLSTGLHLIGPGSTTWALKQQLGIDGSLIGIDVVKDGCLLVKDADEATLWDVIQGEVPHLWLTVIGGQGHVIGRGNAPLSPRVLTAIGRHAMTLLVTPFKLQSLLGKPLRIDSGSLVVDQALSGPVPVVTGPMDKAMMRMVAA